MTERLYGISYIFSPMPDIDTISREGTIAYSPAIVYYDGVSDRFSSVSFPKEFRAFANIGELSPDNRNFFGKLRTAARVNQERLIADFICAVVLKELRQFPNDRFLFVIKDAFETEKIVGRLGYLGLPLGRITIYFISSNLKDFLTNYLAPYSETRSSDLSLLKGMTGLSGPFPEDDAVTMLRTFFWAFSASELYPLRINLFSQFMSHSTLEEQHARMVKYLEQPEWTELCSAEGGIGNERTRLPKVLVRCEDYIASKFSIDEVAIRKKGLLT